MQSTWYGRIALFVLVLIGLRIFFRWNISIIGSLVATLVVYLLITALQSWKTRGPRRTSDPQDR